MMSEKGAKGKERFARPSLAASAVLWPSLRPPAVEFGRETRKTEKGTVISDPSRGEYRGRQRVLGEAGARVPNIKNWNPFQRLVPDGDAEEFNALWLLKQPTKRTPTSR